MDRLLFACLALVVVARVQSYTLRDALRDRELNRLRAFDAYDSNRFSDEDKFRVLNRLRQFHLSQMFDEEIKGCKDEHPDCAMIGELHCKEEEDEVIKGFVEKHCRRTCNVDNCNPNGSIKPPAPELPTCTDDLPKEECTSFKPQCNEQDLIGKYLLKYCSKTCDERC